jgi:hypothetical protein
MTAKTATMQQLIDLGVKVDGIEIKGATVHWAGTKKVKTYFSDGVNKFDIPHQKGDPITFKDKKTGEIRTFKYVSMQIGDGSLTRQEEYEGNMFTVKGEFIEFGDIKWIPEKGQRVDFKFKIETYEKDGETKMKFKGSHLQPAANADLLAMQEAANKVLTACYNALNDAQLLTQWKAIEAQYDAEFNLIWPPEGN